MLHDVVLLSLHSSGNTLLHPTPYQALEGCWECCDEDDDHLTHHKEFHSTLLSLSDKKMFSTVRRLRMIVCVFFLPLTVIYSIICLWWISNKFYFP